MLNIIAFILSAQVLLWAPKVEEVDRIDPASMLALIHIESTGEADARRPNSRYYGLLQISRAYLQDALDHVGEEMVPVRTLLNDGDFSIQVFLWYMDRYQNLHGWRPERMAVLHKGGPTYMGEVLRSMRTKNWTFQKAVCANTRTNACEYLDRFHMYRSAYEEALALGGEI